VSKNSFLDHGLEGSEEEDNGDQQQSSSIGIDVDQYRRAKGPHTRAVFCAHLENLSVDGSIASSWVATMARARAMRLAVQGMEDDVLDTVLGLQRLFSDASSPYTSK
jgi:hypothetical protein